MKVQFFGSLSEIIGREVEIAVPAETTLTELRRRLAETYPAAAEVLCRPSVRASVDGTLVGEDHPVSADSRVAFFPPLSGG